MPTPTIVQKDNPVLRQIAKPVPASMFGTAKLRKIVRDMSDALATQDDGVAIAAPQIGLSLRIFVVSGHALDLIKGGGQSDHNDKNLSNDDAELEIGGDIIEESEPAPTPDLVFINPTIIKISREKKEMEEGCLSVRYLYGKTRRATKARVKAYDVDGKVFEIGGSGLLAQIFQHETDHLDGKLFIDIAKDVHDLPPKK